MRKRKKRHHFKERFLKPKNNQLTIKQLQVIARKPECQAPGKFFLKNIE
jgi:hypothetical protein